MWALDFPERALPGAPLILDLDVHAATFAHLDADHEHAALPSAGAMRAGIGRQLTDQQDRVVGRRVPVQETGDNSTRITNLITAPWKGKGVTA